MTIHRLQLTNWDTALFLAENEYPVSWLDPVTAAQIGVTVEVGAAVLLAVGLMTRPAAIALIALTAISQFVYVQLNARVYWVVLLGWFAIMGSGGLSLDRLLARGVVGSALPGARFLARVYGALTQYAGTIYQLGLRLLVATMLVIGGLGAVGDLPGGALLLHVNFTDALLPNTTPALIAGLLTVIVPALLAFGLATRPVALGGLMLLTGIAAGMAMNTSAFVDLAYCGVILGLIATRGAGVLSLDHLATLRLRSRFPQLDDRPAFDLANTPRVVIVGAGFGGIEAARALRHVPMPHHVDRSSQLSPVSAAALSGGNRDPVAGRHRDTDTQHVRRSAQCAGGARASHRRRPQSARSDHRRPTLPLRLSDRRHGCPA